MIESIRESLLENVLVKDVMTKSVISVDSSSTANDAAKRMEDAKIGSIVVIENSIPVGIITDRDFTIKIVGHAYPIDTPVRRLMSFPLITIMPDSHCGVAADLMSSMKIKKLPVVDDDQVVGIITVSDLVNHFIMNVKNEPNSLSNLM
jgi:signal-transduction protein with cAMP-binding, CBS, and nucleotidyltransferase domain